MKILFIYNADSGKVNSLFDIAHKVVSPSTYKCSLCSLTHDALSEKSEWKKFKNTSRHDLQFLHKDEFEAQYPARYEYPVVLDVTDEAKVLLSASQLKQFKNTRDLITNIEKLVS